MTPYVLRYNHEVTVMDPQPDRDYRFALVAAMQISDVTCGQVAKSCDWHRAYVSQLRIGFRPISEAQIGKLAEACSLSEKAFLALAGMDRAELIIMVENGLRERLR